jgi:hypothetical protein
MTSREVDEDAVAAAEALVTDLEDVRNRIDASLAELDALVDVTHTILVGARDAIEQVLSTKRASHHDPTRNGGGPLTTSGVDDAQ